MQIVKGRDECCRMSAFPEGTQVAHIIPKAEINWFISNAMIQYYPPPKAVNMDGAVNSLLLRSDDLHMSFDAQKFAFVSKGTTSNSPALVMHFLLPSQILSLLYQKVTLQLLIDISIEFLFARFAWAIFPRLEPFFFSGQEKISVLVKEKPEPERMTPEGCRELIKGSMLRLQSPSDSSPIGPSSKKRAFSRLQDVSGDGIENLRIHNQGSEIYVSGDNTGVTGSALLDGSYAKLRRD
jgi:hypothetical protein